MGWTVVPMPDDIKDWFRRQVEGPQHRVLDVAIVKLRHLYAAVEVTDLEGNRSVGAATWLLEFQKNDPFGPTLAYKDMSEEDGPYYMVDCPARILDLLTPTTSADANRWRELCRANLIERTKKKEAATKAQLDIKPGDYVRLERSPGKHVIYLFDRIRGVDAFYKVDEDTGISSVNPVSIKNWFMLPYSKLSPDEVKQLALRRIGVKSDNEASSPKPF